ncbi:MAG: ATP F0F1 synthase subunit C [Ruminiclostridium sp.]|nr:ATP F0F1 synthase subunit C [Ruminiclostridium sp.]
MDPSGLIAISAGIAMFTGIGAGISLGIASSKAAEGVSRNPESAGKILSTALVFATLAEVTAIFGFVVAIMLIGKI